MIKNSVTSLSGPSLLVRNSNVSFCKTLGGIKISSKSESFFVNLTVNFGEIQHFTRPGTFGTGYTSTHTQVNIQQTNYSAPLLFLAMFDDLPGPLSSSFTGYTILSLNHSFVTSCFHPEPLNFYQISFRLLNLYPNGLKAFLQ